MKYIKDIQILIDKMKSDHNPVTIKIDVGEIKRGPSYWKLNNSLLGNTEYREKIITLIDHVWRREDMEVISKYEFLKFEVQRVSIQYSKELAKKRKIRENEIENSLNILNIKLQNGTLTENELTQLDRLRQEKEDMIEYRARGSWIRSRIEHVELNEKSNSYFYQKEVNRFNKKLSIN